ncbi:hypothetical protein BH24ACT16_BH24ACT16_11590 [soil metagenome]
MSRDRPPSPVDSSSGKILAAISGAAAMTLLWAGSLVLPMLLALLIAGIVAGAGGAASAKRLGQGPAGANIAGLCALGGAALVAVPLLLLGAGSGLNGTQVVLFGLALAAISGMGGQVQGGR